MVNNERAGAEILIYSGRSELGSIHFTECAVDLEFMCEVIIENTGWKNAFQNQVGNCTSFLPLLFGLDYSIVHLWLQTGVICRAK